MGAEQFMSIAEWFRAGNNEKSAASENIPDFGNLTDDRDKRIVAVRSAIRSFPGTADIAAGPWSLSAEIDLPIRLHALRAIFVAWSEIVFDGVRKEARAEAFGALAPYVAKLDESLPDFYKLNIISSDYAVSAWEDNTKAARRAVSIVETVNSLEFRQMPFDEGWPSPTPLNTLSIYGPSGRNDMARWRRAQRDAIASDCTVLETGRLGRKELALAALWPNRASAALETNLTMGDSAKNALDLGFYLEKWVRERKDGSLVLNESPEKASERVVRTANLPRSFWETRDAVDTLYAFNYCLNGDLGNEHWGSETTRDPNRGLLLK